MASNPRSGRPTNSRCTDEGLFLDDAGRDVCETGQDKVLKEVRVETIKKKIKSGPNKVKPHKDSMDHSDVIKSGLIGQKDGRGVIVHPAIVSKPE